MKNLKSTLLATLCFFAIASTVLFSSCEQDPCLELNCQNGGNCSNGFCQCPEGWEGAECDITAASKFVGTFVGSMRCDQFPLRIDTARIVLHEDPNMITLFLGTGNTSIIGFTGEARTPETHIETYIEPLEATIHAYIRVDNNIMAIYLETISKNTTHRQICRFNALRVPE